MALNLVIPNKDNLVELEFGGIDLSLATNLVVAFGSETYSLVDDPTIVIVASSTELQLNLSSTAEVGQIFVTVTYFDGGSVNGTDITSREINNLSQIIVAIGTQLIIEDGTIVANANSFATDAELKTYAGIRNYTVPATQPEREALLILAMDYITSKEQLLKGYRVSKDQVLPYPRYGACINGFDIDNNEIPQNLKNAQMELAIQAQNSALFINSQSQNVQREKLGELEVEYFSGGSWSSIRTDGADTYLKPLMVSNGNSNLMTRVLR